jgi:hypothetical protein
MSSNDTNISTKIQAEIDSMKESMTDEVYKRLCDKLLEIHQNEQQEYSFYEVRLLSPYLNTTDEDHIQTMRLRTENRIIRMKQSNAKEFMNRIRDHGSCDIPTTMFGGCVKEEDAVDVHRYCDDCEEIGHIDVVIMYPFQVVTNIVRIK